MPNLIENFPEILTTCRFYIELKLDGSQDPVDAYFMECKGFKRTQDVVEICEVTPQQWGKAKSGQVVRTKVPGNVKTNNVTLRRGMTRSPTLWRWFEAVQRGDWANQLRDGSLTIYDQGEHPQAIFQFRSAWPISYVVSDFNASSNDIEVEEMELAIELFSRQQ
ncbi:phage tail protein [Leptolyngbya sp. FACHB-671]|uniref:phage tail protein n=1 Tax=Leptolyngbya sp. FACHB-671 TaxID=2692812 RepID=UPI00168708AA|nr:phage tail protein [Leptolyngbya sp. FACHB-671]MBD1867182.1 phage tail protein [Cyanobacteria bacterium FACHB-471]MBD2066464.1 phage tail protein [Leptolyngbya sp. FACHB-671]